MRENKLNLSRLMIHSARGIKWLLLLPVCCCSSAQPVTQPSLAANSGELYSTFDPSMAIIILVIISSFFFIALFSIYVRHCYDSTAGEAPPSRAAVNIFQKRGLDPAVIESFPTFIYSAVKDLKLGKGALECAVCLSEFEDDETLRLLPKCDHVFHPECIDAWLASHVTCPVCRTNLTPEHNETIKSTDSNNESNQNQNNSVSESGGIVIDINDEQGSSELQVMETPSRNDVVPPKFTRSHSTGHSLAQAGVSVERYTLRLPEEIRKQIIMSGKYKRAQSFNVILARQGGSIRGGYRSGGEGSSRGRSYADRWIFSMTPPFVSKVGSLNSMKVANGGEGDGSSNGRTFLTAVKAPLNCLNVKVEQGEESSSSRTRPQI